jgi:acetyl esterase/lipase
MVVEDRSSASWFLAAAAAVVIAGVVGGAWWLARPHPTFTPPPGVHGVPAHRGTLPDSDPPPPTLTVTGVRYGDDPTQLLDLYRPPGVHGRLLPVIVYFHSGGWVGGTRADVPDFLLREVSQLHVELASVDYRITSDGHNRFPAASQDADRAVRWLKASAAELGLDPKRFVLAGTSAGGHLAALDAAAPGQFVAPDLPVPLAGQDPRVRGVIDAVGPSNLATLGTTGGSLGATLETEFLGCVVPEPATCSPLMVADASVAGHLTAAAPPAFFVYGSKDTLVRPSTQGRPLAAAWAAARGDAAREPPGRWAVWYEEAADGHNVSQSTVDMSALTDWLSAVLDGRLR